MSLNVSEIINELLSRQLKPGETADVLFSKAQVPIAREILLKMGADLFYPINPELITTAHGQIDTMVCRWPKYPDTNIGLWTVRYQKEQNFLLIFRVGQNLPQ